MCVSHQIELKTPSHMNTNQMRARCDRCAGQLSAAIIVVVIAVIRRRVSVTIAITISISISVAAVVVVA